MFDITSSKLFLLAIVALLVIGPKDFPLLLRTIGKYVGIIRGHAREFRAQFDEAMRESELSELKQDMEKMARETEASLNATGKSVEQTFDEARQSIQSSVEDTVTENPLAPAAESTPAADVPPADPAPQAAETVTADGPAGQPPAGEPPAAAPEPAAPTTVVAAPAPAVEPAPPAQPAVERTGA